MLTQSDLSLQLIYKVKLTNLYNYRRTDGDVVITLICSEYGLFWTEYGLFWTGDDDIAEQNSNHDCFQETWIPSLCTKILMTQSEHTYTNPLLISI